MKHKISNLEKLEVKRLQDLEYKRRIVNPTKRTDEFGNVFEPITEIDLQREKDLYNSLKTDPQKFLDKPVLKPNILGDLKEGTVVATGNKYPKYSEQVINSAEKIVSERVEKYEHTDQEAKLKKISEKMEVIFADLIHKIFPGFETNIPAQVDDLLNATDLTLFHKDGEKIRDIFSFDMTFQQDKASDVFWKRKFFRNFSKILNGNFSYINYINYKDLFFSAENAPVFVLPISRETLDKLVLEYSVSPNEAFTIEKIKEEIRYCIFLQIQVFKIIFEKVAPERKKNLEKIIASLETNFTDFSEKPKKFNDKTLENVCSFLEKTLSNKNKFLKNLVFQKDTLDLKAEDKRIIEKTEKDHKSMSPRERKIHKKNKETRNIWDKIKKRLGF